SPPHFHFGQTNKTPEFLRKFPLGKVPAFEGDDGFCVFDSNAIAYYVSNEELRGTTRERAAEIVQWVNFADSDIVPPASTWVFPTLGIMGYNKQATEQAKEEVRRVLGVLDAHLRTQTFLVGERVSLADISVVCALLWLYKQVLEPSFRQPFVNVNRWFVTCLNQPQFKAVLGEVTLCQKMAQFDGMGTSGTLETLRWDMGTMGGHHGTPWGGYCHNGGDRDKDKDPFGHLPRSPFVLDEFKRKFSNEDTLGVALPHFWQHFDPVGWSLWLAEYRFPQELTQVFMSCNLIT
ncbi:eukaryotic translation elongation factor 1 gamma, partial [Columba livia]